MTEARAFTFLGLQGKTEWIERQKCIVSEFTRLEVQNQGVGDVMLSLRTLWKGRLHAFFVSSITNNRWLQSHHDNPISVVACHSACHSFCLSHAMLLPLCLCPSDSVLKSGYIQRCRESFNVPFENTVQPRKLN